MTLKDLDVEDARARMLAGVRPGAPEAILLDAHAQGRVLAEPISAVRDQPPFDVSAMDGYAVAQAATNWAAGFAVAGESAAGRPFSGVLGVGQLGVGQALRVFTGAAVPPGCAVVVQERAARDGGRVRFDGAAPSGPENVRPRGGDFRAGDVLLPAGVRLDAWRLGLAAAAGRAQAQVFPQPRVAILSTGEEIVPAGTTDIAAAQIFDSSGPALAALVARWGGRPVALRPARDAEDAILAAIDGVDAELIVTVGGASVGDYDLVKPALRRRGLALKVESLRLRPGKPTWFGVLGDGRRVLGLPGNPASGLVAAELFLRPLLAAWQGGDPTPPLQPVRLDRALNDAGPREHWMRAALQVRTDGTTWAIPFLDQDSSLVSVFARADALIRHPADAPALAAGDVVQALRLERL